MQYPDAGRRAAIAAHRFGLGEATLDNVRPDPLAWLLAQVGPAEPQLDLPGKPALPSSAEAVALQADVVRRRRMAREVDAAASAPAAAVSEQPLRDALLADQRARLATAVRSPRPFAERLAMFWSNHFTVSTGKASMRGLAGSFEREAIRPHIAGRFETMLVASTTHAAMLRYLDNESSAGPRSRLATRLAQRQARQPEDTALASRRVGLNENLAREVLELHTLGAVSARQGVYTQADVTAFAKVLTGWRVVTPPAPVNAAQAESASPTQPAFVPTRFDPAWHEPGAQTLLGRTFDDADDGSSLLAVLQHLAQHPATARFVCGQLARHFVADDPPPALVDRMVQAWQRSSGDLPSVYQALLTSPQAWAPEPQKLKTPEELAISSLRLLGGADALWARQPDAAIGQMGQRLQAAPSPAGWPDQAADWLGPEAVWKRVEWATRLADRAARTTDARALAPASLGPWLTEPTRLQIQRAADGPQALALLLLSPEFQRR